MEWGAEGAARAFGTGLLWTRAVVCSHVAGVFIAARAAGGRWWEEEVEHFEDGGWRRGLGLPRRG